MTRNASEPVAFLTKREFIATMLLQGLLMYPHVNPSGSEDLTVEKAFTYAKALLERIEKEGKLDEQQ
jgi:cytochrome bd-type quinol oxidase subunit 2